MLQFMKHVADRHYMEMSLIEAKVSESSKLKGLSILDAQLRAELGVIIVAIRRGDQDMLFNPGPKEWLLAGGMFSFSWGTMKSWWRPSKR